MVYHASLFSKLRKAVDRDDEGLRGMRKRLNLKDEMHHKECMTSSYLNKGYSSQQEIIRLPCHLRFFIGKVTTTTGGFDNPHER